MKRLWGLVVFQVLMGAALAQSPPSDPVIPKRSITLTAEQSYTIKEIVLKDKSIDGVRADQVAKPVKIGEESPDAVELHDFPALLVEKVPQVKAHKFFVLDDQVVIVNPSNKIVADILK